MNRQKFRTLLGIVVIALLVISYSTTALASNLGVRNLRKGMVGDDVTTLQQKLNNLGYEVDVDGVFGSGTEEIVKKFQQQKDLAPDGIVGTKTIYYLINDKVDLEYEVQSGDSLYDLAQEYDVDVATIKQENNLTSNIIIPGQELTIPETALGGGRNKDAYTIVIDYQISSGDTLTELAKRYNSDVKEIKELNRLSNDSIRTGQTIKIPRRSENSKNRQQKVNSYRSRFIWPVQGKITSSYGQRVHPITSENHFHGGIDISVPKGSTVKAAAGGRVITSSWVKGFGKTVIIAHDERTKTLYAHNSQLLVRSGEHVNQGQRIARSGSTGRSTGPHLDFRIFVNEDTINPLQKLPNKS
ncbi:MAG: peptidoglycan DD-metalloendopeptidase family protein [Bacillota bacterium]